MQIWFSIVDARDVSVILFFCMKDNKDGVRN